MTTVYNSNSPPIKAAAWTFYISLTSQADTKLFQTSVTLAAGDVVVYKDGVLDGNIDALPVEIGTTGILAVALSATEMNANTVSVRFRDAAGSQWCDLIATVFTVVAATVSDGTGVTLATGAVSAAAVATDAVTEIATGVWASATRTLTASSTGATTTTAATYIARKRGDSWSISVTGLGALTGYTSIWFTIKTSPADADTSALVQIKLNATGLLDGLLYVNGAAAVDDTKGSIVIDDQAAGNITIALDESITDDLAPALVYYDIQTLISAAVSTPSAGTFEISEDITRSIA